MKSSRFFCFLSLALILAGCSSERELDQQLRKLIQIHGLDQPFVADSQPASKMLADLGQQMFFSPDLSVDGNISCASCHHPTLAGADGIPLPVGIGGSDSTHIGQERIDAVRKINPEVDLQGLIPRNTPTVFNAALFRQNLFWDGRVQYQDDPDHAGKKKVVEGVFPAQHNPSNYVQENLLQTQARLPLNAGFEMKGASVRNRNGHEVEQGILNFLQSQERWCKAFAKVYGVKPCNETITLTHLTQALGAFEATLIFTQSPFQRYAKGDDKSLTVEQKRGAIAFLTSKEQGGVGCVSCHSGNTFSSEKFYNINIPPSGRGANDNGWDLGRYNVDRTAERFSFRVPILLNVALTGPYFHNGVADTLENAIRMKQTAHDAVKPAKQILIDQFDYKAVTTEIAADFDKSAAKPLLPETLSETQITDLAAFLRSLSDDCLNDKSCTEKMVPEIVKSPRAPVVIRDDASAYSVRKAVAVEAPKLDCKRSATKRPVAGNSREGFTRHALDVGLDHTRAIGLINKGWLVDVVNYASVSATDVDYDCLDDMVFDAGENGLLFYRQQEDGRFERASLPYTKQPNGVNSLILDLDGDYRYDMFVGTYGKTPAAFVFDFQHRSDDVSNLVALTGPVINASTGDINADGSLDVVFGMWRSFSSFKQPHIWFGDQAGNLSSEGGFITLLQNENHVGGDEYIKRHSRMDIGQSDLTFTPNLVDIDGDGSEDMLLASDFFRSQVLKNTSGRLENITDKSVIDDSNGMGAAIGDFDNNGTPDWFVTSIVDRTLPGLTRGHRLYLNEGEGKFAQGTLVNKEVEWSWGACTADFNNDGALDLFYVSGYGEPLQTARYETEAQQQASGHFFQENARYASARPTLLINDGKGGFVDQTARYGLDQPLNGRGVSCFDYQQDGDIDIAVAPLEGSPVLFRNEDTTSNHWVSLRLIGLPGNTEALGTQVAVHTGKGVQRREVRFENNFVSRNPAQLHFGLSDADKIEKVVITLPAPNRKTVELSGLELDRLHVLYVSELLKM